MERKSTQPVAAMTWVVLRSMPRSCTVAFVGAPPWNVLSYRPRAGSLVAVVAVVAVAAAAAVAVGWNANPPDLLLLWLLWQL